MAADAEDLARLERGVLDLRRSRAVCLILLVVPFLLHILFERQARRLDALAEHGASTTAVVQSVSSQGSSSYTTYAYTVDGASYDWSVGRDDAPFAKGETFPVRYLPEDPSFSRPGSGATTEEAARNRVFSRKVVGGLTGLLVVCALACELKLRRFRKRGLDELRDPKAIQRRVAFMGVILLPVFGLIFQHHFEDAVKRGESVWPVVLAPILLVSIFGSVGVYIFRRGQAHAPSRGARLMTWVFPLAGLAALLRLLALLLGGA